MHFWLHLYTVSCLGILHLPGLAASLRGECAQVQRMRWAGMAKYHKGLFHMAIRVFFKDLHDHWSKVKREIGAKHFYKPCGNRTIILKIIALVTFYQQQPQVTVFFLLCALTSRYLIQNIHIYVETTSMYLPGDPWTTNVQVKTPARARELSSAASRSFQDVICVIFPSQIVWKWSHRVLTNSRCDKVLF